MISDLCILWGSPLALGAKGKVIITLTTYPAYDILTGSYTYKDIIKTHGSESRGQVK